MPTPSQRTAFSTSAVSFDRSTRRAGGRGEPIERRPRTYPALNDTAIVFATIIVLVATPAALYFLVSEKLLSSLAALMTALGAAFGPKIYADFIQPKASPAAAEHRP